MNTTDVTDDTDDTATDPQVTGGRTAAWADPEPSTDPNAIQPDSSMPPPFWSARHVVLLPEGVSFEQATQTECPIEVTVIADISPIDSGLDEIHQRYRAEWCTTKPEQRVIASSLLLAPVQPDTSGQFHARRDAHRITHGLPRAVIRSDVYDKTTGSRAKHHALRHPWPEDTFAQGGRASRVVEAAAEHRTDPDVHIIERPGEPPKAVVSDRVFIEFFPPATATQPSTLLRGEGVTFAEAEDAAWARWSRISDCPSPTGAHEWEARGYRNGAGFCHHCNMFGSRVFTAEDLGLSCVVCGTPTLWSSVPRFDGPQGSDETAEVDMTCPDHTPPDASAILDVLDGDEEEEEDEEEQEGEEEEHGRSPFTREDICSALAVRLPPGTDPAQLPFKGRYSIAQRVRRDLVDQLIARADSRRPAPPPVTTGV